MTHQELTAALSAAGVLPESWAGTFAAVDRGRFIPARAWFDDEHGHPQPLDQERDPERWRAAVYSDEPIVTQLDDGATVWPATSNAATSSASQPSMVLTMLDALEVRDGHRVLEIGTGTGYTAALLAHRLGAHSVTSVEIDPAAAEQARVNLTAAGYPPPVVCADGTAGWAPTAPYDRILATAAVLAGQLPYAWVEQTRPGGLLVTPWGTAYHNGALVRPTCNAAGTLRTTAATRCCSTTCRPTPRPVSTSPPRPRPAGFTGSARMDPASSGTRSSTPTAGGSGTAGPPAPATA
ncbi:MAG TPA: methyltransferase domain-containing protein [Pseudonocardiaceae bacterium]|nr:methyltransferase domain-containing protein [Pseudonocardiaceae bacterium]